MSEFFLCIFSLDRERPCFVKLINEVACSTSPFSSLNTIQFNLIRIYNSFGRRWYEPLDLRTLLSEGLGPGIQRDHSTKLMYRLSGFPKSRGALSKDP